MKFSSIANVITVVFSGKLVTLQICTSGVPQGSYIGPILFCTFISDTKSAIKNHTFLLPADAMRISRTVSCDYDNSTSLFVFRVFVKIYG